MEPRQCSAVLCYVLQPPKLQGAHRLAAAHWRLFWAPFECAQALRTIHHFAFNVISPSSPPVQAGQTGAQRELSGASWAPIWRRPRGEAVWPEASGLLAPVGGQSLACERLKVGRRVEQNGAENGANWGGKWAEVGPKQLCLGHCSSRRPAINQATAPACLRPAGAAQSARQRAALVQPLGCASAATLVHLWCSWRPMGPAAWGQKAGRWLSLAARAHL